MERPHLSTLGDTVKHVYSDHAFNEMTLYYEAFGNPWQTLYKFYAYSEVAYNEITIYNVVILKPLGIKDHIFWHVYSELV